MRLTTLVPAAILFFAEESLAQNNQNKDDPLEVLGEAAWTRLRPGWSLTVNDQCLYEFIFQFEHDERLPVGEQEFRETCSFGEQPQTAPDGKLYLEPRQMWERFPDYVWATIGFNHLSVDWHACGHRPRGYAMAHYDFSVSEIHGASVHSVFFTMLTDRHSFCNLCSSFVSHPSFVRWQWTASF